MKAQSTRHQHDCTQEAALKASALHWMYSYQDCPSCTLHQPGLHTAAAPASTIDFTHAMRFGRPCQVGRPVLPRDQPLRLLPTITKQHPPARPLCQPLPLSSSCHEAAYSICIYLGITCHHLPQRLMPHHGHMLPRTVQFHNSQYCSYGQPAAIV
jgi:hypothetical protein